ncbi:hypothetical protein SCHPADRAFT_983689 [Schizopora paradoxa]|uniref:Ubiquitin-like protease family profile domain-containing protein n=1 Tax=Schizopora paradoxa TaxID=27342 RepID=A0A0H2RRX9_9AGAM|nr:hypothetical protein SCHPADRAFT_983689 [Schizopora paradoxa]
MTKLWLLRKSLTASKSIPPAFKNQFLPDTSLSIHDLCSFPFPPTLTQCNIPATGFLGHNKPIRVEGGKLQLTVEDLRKIPVPPPELLLSIESVLCTGTPKALSLVCPHSKVLHGACLLLWVVTWWTKVLIILEESIAPWREAEKSLSKDGEAKEMLHPCIQGIDYLNPAKELTTYMTSNWFSNVHENQMLELLRVSAQHDEGLKDCVAVESSYSTFWNVPWTVQNILECHSPQLELLGEVLLPKLWGSNTYATSEHFQWVCTLGHSLASGYQTKLVTIIHVDGNHWISIIIDFKNGLFMILDSLGREISEEMVHVFRWWIEIHCGKDFCVLKLAYADIDAPPPPNRPNPARDPPPQPDNDDVPKQESPPTSPPPASLVRSMSPDQLPPLPSPTPPPRPNRHRRAPITQAFNPRPYNANAEARRRRRANEEPEFSLLPPATRARSQSRPLESADEDELNLPPPAAEFEPAPAPPPMASIEEVVSDDDELNLHAHQAVELDDGHEDMLESTLKASLADGVEYMQSKWVSMDVHQVLELVFAESALKVDAGTPAPRTFGEAVSRPDGEHYLQAAIDEVKALVDNGTFIVRERRPTDRPIGCLVL